MSNKKVIVTGADGFIGSHLVEALVTNGYDVKAFCWYNSFGHKGWLDQSSKEIKDQIEFVLGDIRDPHHVEKAVNGCELVFHLASLIAIPYSYHAPQSYIDTNITGTLNVLQASLKSNVKQVMHTSTSEVYGTAQYVPIDEKHPLIGQSPYAASKIGADQVALSFYRSFDLPVSIMRPFNTYGPRQSARAVIPTIITQLIGGNKNIKLGNINATRDFNYVKDTVQGMMAFINNKESLGKVINIGCGFEVSIRDIAILIAKIMDLKINFEVEQERIRPEKSEVERLLACTRLMKSILKWEASYATMNGVEIALKETIEWFIVNKGSSFYNNDINKYTI